MGSACPTYSYPEKPEILSCTFSTLSKNKTKSFSTIASGPPSSETLMVDRLDDTVVILPQLLKIIAATPPPKNPHF